MRISAYLSPHVTHGLQKENVVVVMEKHVVVVNARAHQRIAGRPGVAVARLG